MADLPAKFHLLDPPALVQPVRRSLQAPAIWLARGDSNARAPAARAERGEQSKDHPRAMLPGFLPVVAPTVPAGGDEFTKLLLHCDGSNGSTSFPDSSASAHTVTANGNAQVSTAQAKFAQSLALDGSAGTYLSVPSSADLNITNAGGFTVDWWMRFTNSGATEVIIERFEGQTGPGWSIFKDASNRLGLYSNGGAIWITGTTAMAVATWYHGAITRSGSTLRLFVNGTQEASTAASPNDSASNPLRIGHRTANDSIRMTGFLDEIRISNIARWTANFTPPNQAYS